MLRMLLILAAVLFMVSCEDSITEDFSEIQPEQVDTPGGEEDEDEDDPIIIDPPGSGNGG